MPRAKGKAPAKKAAAKRPLPKNPAAKIARTQEPDAPPPTPSKPLEVAHPVAAVMYRPLGSVDVDSLSGEALRAYARKAGVSPRDVAGLTEDRLRQNTKLVIANLFELLTE